MFGIMLHEHKASFQYTGYDVFQLLEQPNVEIDITSKLPDNKVLFIFALNLLTYCFRFDFP